MGNKFTVRRGTQTKDAKKEKKRKPGQKGRSYRRKNGMKNTTSLQYNGDEIWKYSVLYFHILFFCTDSVLKNDEIEFQIFPVILMTVTCFLSQVISHQWSSTETLTWILTKGTKWSFRSKTFLQFLAGQNRCMFISNSVQVIFISFLGLIHFTLLQFQHSPQLWT